ncbi:segregation and condensation protein A [Yinghuangia seranimata]|uniref:segregation and condensation protein A n=1 Tax=Yinghuangia seranimata TaxID=408067 RepID=UPI00248C2288|nr:segregation/condensation protein A [Yinghuangia seranimata]MDI2131825.1 segregation/condensation protein A [Yinghuangia seranimata]
MPTANSVPPARRALGRGPGAEPTAPPAGPDEPVEPTEAVETAAEAAERAEPVVEAVEPEPEAGAAEPAEVPEAAAEAVQESAVVAVVDAGPVGPTAATPGAESEHKGFAVRLDNFEGPFDLLLGLIAKHKLDVTEVSLSKVTDEFIAYIRAQGPDWDLGVATEFLVVAATLLDLKAARLLPAAEVEDEEDLALLEARDLLFARLLQYRAYKEIASIFEDRWAKEGRRYPRSVPLEERYTGLLPEIVIKMDLDKFARLAARAMTPKEPKLVSIEHIHVQRVSVREQSAIVVERLRRHGALTFRALTDDCPDNLHVIARFLCLLELFREAAVGFDQVEALGELHVRWTGGDTDAPEVGAEFDEADGTAPAPDGPEASAEPEEQRDDVEEPV